MKTSRISALTCSALILLAACGGEKVQPADNAAAATELTPEQEQAKAAEDYRKRQEAFADSVLKGTKSVTDVAKDLGAQYQVGSVQMRDSLMKYVAATPQCLKSGRDMDPYLSGTVTFYIHMSVVGSDVVRVQTSDWTSKAGAVTDKCLNEAARGWKFPMGMNKQGNYLLQVQFK